MDPHTQCQALCGQGVLVGEVAWQACPPHCLPFHILKLRLECTGPSLPGKQLEALQPTPSTCPTQFTVHTACPPLPHAHLTLPHLPTPTVTADWPLLFMSYSWNVPFHGGQCGADEDLCASPRKACPNGAAPMWSISPCFQCPSELLPELLFSLLCPLSVWAACRKRSGVSEVEVRVSEQGFGCSYALSLKGSEQEKSPFQFPR